MANWVAGHTDRFRAIVTHASLWALDQFGRYDRQLGVLAARSSRPRRWWRTRRTGSSTRIRTPLLVIHGDRDYRVPIGESLRLWSELAEHHAAADGIDACTGSCYYPDENHWVLKPQHAVVWYQTVFAFLDQHVHGAEWKRPELLG